MASKFQAFFDNILSGATNPKGNLADWQHARALYTNDDFRLAPKQKFLYHVTFNLNADAVKVIPQLNTYELNMLVKAVELPKYSVSTNLKHQYNQKRVLQTRMDYDPVSITFHDDNFGMTTAMWEAYYRYYWRDGTYASFTAGDNGTPQDRSAAYNRGNTYNGEVVNGFRYGMDNDSFQNFFNSIQIWQMSRRRYTCFTLVNPLITSWQHDTMENSASDAVQSTMQLSYETVWYGRGAVQQGIAPKSFGSPSGHYDTSPSPLTIEGGGTVSLTGRGGVLEGGLSVLGDITSRQAFKSPTAFLGTVLKGANVFKNAKSLSRGGLRQEGFNILKGAIGAIGSVNQVGGVANTLFPKGSATSLVSTISGVTAVTSLVSAVQTSSGTEIANSLLTNQGKLNDLVVAFTGKKDHLNAGGASSIDAMVDTFNSLPESSKETKRNEIIAQAETLAKNNPHLRFT